MNEVIRLSRREAKPFMGKPNVIRSKKKTFSGGDILDDVMGEYLAEPGQMVFGLPLVTPSPTRTPPSLGKKQRNRYNELNAKHKNKVQVNLFQDGERVTGMKEKRSVRLNNRRFRMGLAEMDFENETDIYDARERRIAQLNNSNRYYTRMAGKRSKY